ncbi:MAG: RMD1 family protein, partial [Rhizobiales bacterium]|nr:RMD1 family protein [Hyphomicrobiales bacterium]
MEYDQSSAIQPLDTAEQAVTGGTAQPLRIRALLLGDRLDTSGLERRDMIASTPFAFRVNDNGFVAFFRYGAVVFAGLTRSQEEGYLESINSRISGKLPSFEEEIAYITINEDLNDQVPPGGPIQLKELEPERLLVIADVLAKSVALAHNERRIGAFFRVVDPLARNLAENGTLPRNRRDILVLICESLIVSHRMSARVAVDDKPDILWDRVDLERLYSRMEDEYELKERASTLADKVETVQNTASALTDLIDAQRSYRLEITIVILIAVELGIAVF